MLRESIEAARPGTDSTVDVIQRIVTAMVYAGDRVRFLFTATEGTPSGSDAGIAHQVDELMIAEIEPSQHEGTLDSAVPARWIELIIWSTGYTGLHAAADGLVPKHGVDVLVRSTLQRAIGNLSA